MSRYRPPRPRSSPYITEAGYQRLNEELKYLWKEKRPEVTRKGSEAAAQGDRSENAEYICGKKQLREIDGRVRFLSKRLDELTVIGRTSAVEVCITTTPVIQQYQAAPSAATGLVLVAGYLIITIKQL